MKLSPLFHLREEATPELMTLLTSVTLGTNGAQYRHLDTPRRIQEADQPLHLTVERNQRVIGNTTFCRRSPYWYVRYFAFDNVLQGSGQKKSKAGTGRLKQEITSFFDAVLSKEQPYGNIHAFYAYIDPNNEKSLWMSEKFGFQSIAKIATQSFSRSRLPKTTKVEKSNIWTEVAPIIRKQFASDQFYFEAQVSKGPYFILRDDYGEIIACTKVTTARWAIERMPGKMGGWLPKTIPFVPRLRRIIRPKKHTFLVPEAVYVKDNNPKLLTELFEGVLASEREHLLLWWVDRKAPIFRATHDRVNWGLLHRLIGVNDAHLVVKHNRDFEWDNSKPVYTCGFDFV